MTFRHPLRNDWDQLKPQFEAAALRPDADGATARAMLQMIPPFLDVIEQQRDVKLPAHARLSSMFAVIGMLMENTVEAAYRSPAERVQALQALLSRLNNTLRPRLAKRAPVAGGGNGLILPGQG